MKPKNLNCEPSSTPAAPQQAPGSQRGAAGVDERGYPSNTPPSTPKYDLCKCSGGEDWLELSLYLQHLDFPELKALLDSAREAAEIGEEGPDELEIAGRKFLMLPSGAAAGSDKKKIVYGWRLRAPDGWWLLLMNRADVHKTLPTGCARAPSLPLLRIGPRAFVHQLQETLQALRIRVIREKVSRVDACVDLTDMKIDSLHGAAMRGHYVSRARYSTEHIADESFKGHRFRRRPTGFDLGKGATRVRVYDKFFKCQSDPEMLLLMQTRRWGEIGSDAIRVEFQLRREKLKSLGVDCVSNWWEKRGSITHYLTHEWFRVTSEVVDSDHAKRTPTHSDWERVQEAFAAWSGEPLAQLRPLPKLPIRADNLLRQVIGTLVSYHAQVGTNIDGNEAFAHESFVAVLDEIEKRNMASEVLRRALEMGVLRR